MPTILLSKIYPKGSALKNLRVGSTDVKYVKRGDGKLFYDTLKSTTYNKPSITLTYSTSSTSAAGGTTSPSSFSYSQSWYYTGHSDNTYPQTNKTSGATVRYSISGTGASINESTGVVTWASRGTTYSTSTREATVTVEVAMNGQSNTATFVVKLAKNVITKVAITVNAGALTNPSTYAAGGATKSVANKTAASASAKLTYSSGSTRNTSNSDYGTWTGPTYSWTSNKSYATLTSANSASLNVTMPSRGTTTGNARSATITRKVSYTYTLSSSYNNANLSAVSGSANATATVTLQANNIVSTDTYYTIIMDSNPNPNLGPIPQAGTEMALHAAAHKQIGTTYTSGSVSYGDNTYLTVTVKVYINNILQTTYTVPHNAGSPLWQCPANTTGQSRTIKFVASISESTLTATFENIQLGSSDIYVFQSGWNMIGYDTAASGFTADVGITSTKNGTPLSFAVTSAASWLSGTISLPSGFPYGTHLFTVRASANTGSARSGTITITLTGSGMTLTFTLTQLGV